MGWGSCCILTDDFLLSFFISPLFFLHEIHSETTMLKALDVCQKELLATPGLSCTV